MEYEGDQYTVVEIGERAFSEEGRTDGKTLNSINIDQSVKRICKYAFAGCTGLKSIAIPSRATLIEEGAFKDCTSLGSVTTGSYLAEIGNSAFYGCTKLASLTLPSSLKKLGTYAFAYCTSLQSIKVPSKLTVVGEGWFKDCTSLASATLPDVTEIKAYAFQNCKSLASIDLHSSLTVMGQSAFDGCASLTKIGLPSSLVEMGASSFQNCTKLTSVTFADNESILKLGADAFTGSPVESLTLGRTLSCTVTTGAFKAQKNLKNVTITSAVRYIPENIFRECSALQTVKIAEGLTEIKTGAFRECTVLAEIKIPSTVNRIGSYTFQDCHKLARVNIPDDVTVLDMNLFYNCGSLASITIPSNITDIKRSAFQECQRLEAVVIPAEVQNIGDNAFNKCIALKEVVIPENVITLGQSAFFDCKELRNVKFNEAESILRMGAAVFASCPVSTLYLGRSIDYTGKTDDIAPFDNNTTLETVEISSNVNRICTKMFSNCSSLRSVSLSPSISSIGEYAFEDCQALAEIKSLNDTAPKAYDNSWSQTSYENAKLTINDDAQDSYRSAAGWKNFKSLSIIPGRPKYNVTATYDALAGSVTLNGQDVTSLTVREGESLSIAATPNEGKIVSDAYYTMGTVTKHFKDRVSIDNVTANVTVNVSFIERPKIEATSIAFVPDVVSVNINQGRRLTLVCSPENATPEITWSIVNDNKIISIDESGYVVGLQIGKAIVKAETDNGLTAQCTVNVINSEGSGVELVAGGDGRLAVGQKAKVILTYMGEIVSEDIQWTSDNQSIIVVNHTGEISVKEFTSDYPQTVTVTGKSASGIEGSISIPVTELAYAFFDEGINYISAPRTGYSTVGASLYMCDYTAPVNIKSYASDGYFNYKVTDVYINMQAPSGAQFNLPETIEWFDYITIACDNFTLTCRAVTPPASEKGRKVLNEWGGFNLVVPDESIDAYASDEHWNSYTTINGINGGKPDDSVEAPVFSIPDGSVVEYGKMLTLTTPTEGADIYYAYNYGSVAPSLEECTELYSGPITITDNMAFTAYAIKSGRSSDAVSAKYVLETIEAPVFSIPTGSTVASGTTITLSCSTSGAEIYYMFGDRYPDPEYATRYTGPISIDKDHNMIAALAYKPAGKRSSEVSVAEYTVSSAPVPGGDEQSTATFDFTQPGTLSPSYSEEGASKENSNLYHVVSDVRFTNTGVSVSATKGKSTDARLYYNGSWAYRVYNGATITITAPAAIEKVEFKLSKGTVTPPSAGNWASNTWTATSPDATSLDFSVSSNSTITVITVTYTIPASVDGIIVDSEEEVEYYNMNGLKVNNPGPGIYIMRKGTTISKVTVR